jgi:A/G-specific adenine glycosylase
MRPMPVTTMPPEPAATARQLVTWFRKHGRDYPWRRTHDPYAILVSEIMLQQTQIATVLGRGYYARWLERFPDFERLASASEEQVLKAWEGLGYYRRARNLHRLAKEVIEKHGGVFPRDHATILSLPGIGPYTAGAVASLAFGLAQPVVDGNVARVLSRLYNDATPVDSTAGVKLLWQHAGELVGTTDDPRVLNSALMELGQTHCTPAKPACDLCPVRAQCRAKEPESLPVKQARQEITAVTERVVFLRTDEGVLLEQETGGRRTGLWKLPALPAVHENKPPPVLMRTNYGITRYKVTLWVHEAPRQHPVWPDTHRVITFAEIGSTPMPAPYRRALDDLLKRAEFKLDS